MYVNTFVCTCVRAHACMHACGQKEHTSCLEAVACMPVLHVCMHAGGQDEHTPCLEVCLSYRPHRFELYNHSAIETHMRREHKHKQALQFSAVGPHLKCA
mmetsp:Transcript_2906/g.7816  ORF Transcript_2906/g.7816 Transcript_2906/m.7816 type:complete len:100 (-) Transcript_2906:42-341(-)